MCAGVRPLCDVSTQDFVLIRPEDETRWLPLLPPPANATMARAAPRRTSPEPAKITRYSMVRRSRGVRGAVRCLGAWTGLLGGGGVRLFLATSRLRVATASGDSRVPILPA